MTGATPERDAIPPVAPIFDIDATTLAPKTPLARVADAIGRALAILFIVAVAISAYEVVMRYAFTRPSSWAQETVTTLCAICFAVGGAFAMARGEHIAITVLADRFRPRLRRFAVLVGLAVGLVYLAGLVWGLWLQTGESVLRFGAGGRWEPELTPGPPNWPLPSLAKAVLLLSTALFFAVVAERLVTVARRAG